MSAGQPSRADRFAAYVEAVTDASEQAHEETVEIVAFHGTRRTTAREFARITEREAVAHGRALERAGL